MRNLARTLGVDPGSLNRMEHGKQNVTIKPVGKLCQRLECDGGHLFAEPPRSREDEA